LCKGRPFNVTLKSAGMSSHVDVYDEKSNRWTNYPTGLRQARGVLVAAALPSGLVFFAGGFTGNDPPICTCQFTLMHEIVDDAS
jgi:hypothetical protein